MQRFIYKIVLISITAEAIKAQSEINMPLLRVDDVTQLSPEVAKTNISVRFQAVAGTE